MAKTKLKKKRHGIELTQSQIDKSEYKKACLKTNLEVNVNVSFKKVR